MENLLKRIYQSRRLCAVLHTLSYASVAVLGILFVLLLSEAYKASLLSAVKTALILAVPFVAVSITRVIINSPRPYEVYTFFDKLPKKKCGKSFPSRHVFSAFAISTSLMFVTPVAGCIGIVFSLILCISRTLLGIHFIRDVVAGALCGILSSVIGFLITTPF